MLLTELYNHLDNPVEFNFGAANYTNNSDQLTYRVTNLPVETSVGGVVIKDAGTVMLGVDPKEFAGKVAEASDDGVQSIDKVKLTHPLQNFKCEESQCSKVFDMRTQYTLSVAYTNNNGEQQVTRVTFNDSAFEPSEELRGLKGS